ncbi:MAG: VCBS repeat-containing protein [Flavitalea sp.]
MLSIAFPTILRISRLMPLLIMLTTACESIEDKNKDTALEKPVESTGQSLSRIHCASCHAYVPPSQLDSATWNEQVLPAMAAKMGIGVWQNNQYFSPKNNDSGTAVSLEEWDQIVEFYANNSLVQMPVEKHLPLEKDWSGFSLVVPRSQNKALSTTTLVAIDSVNHVVYTSDESSKLSKWKNGIKEDAGIQLPSQAVSMSFPKANFNAREAIVTCIGNIMATDETKGTVAGISLTKSYLSKPIAANLRRPVYSTVYDYDKDGKAEILVCGFGHEKGALSILRQKNGEYEQEVMWARSGALQIENFDYDNDGWMDFIALFGQGDEGIWLFRNNGKGGFEKKQLLAFSPLNGSSSFQLYDFNKDGRIDILYTCGDNSDHSRILKPFHGMYIYLNASRDRFTEKYFYPMNGCTKAIVRDFDLDGKPEIAAIAFFADLSEHDPRTFLYFREESMMDFKPVEIPVSKHGRWICMDAKDIDGDGDIDIVLGNYSKGFINQEDAVKDWDGQMPFVILKNDAMRNR